MKDNTQFNKRAGKYLKTESIEGNSSRVLLGKLDVIKRFKL